MIQMTKQEAIEYMRMYKGENVNGESHLGHAFDLSDEIIDMAIEALQRGLENVNADSCSEKPNRSEPKTAESGSVDSEMPEIKSNRTTGGMIYRQDAIEALEKQLDYLQMLNKDENPKAESKWYGINWARNTIAELPSAQPVIIQCKDCWHYPSEYADCPMIGWREMKTTFVQKQKGEPMSERKMIYLDDALDILDDLQSGYENGFNIYADSRKQMLDLPSAQPETHEKRTETHACDFISRQDAINAINHELRCGAVIDQCGLETAHDLIEDLPSAQPEIIFCRDCIYQKESWCGIKYCEANGDHIGKDYDYCSNVRRKDNERFY